MSDLFISYASQDRKLVHVLASELQRAGYSVWWDRELISGDNFRNVILDQLASADLVIVVWTANSVKSEWVISEATRAHALHKLAPIRVQDLGLNDIPPPFDLLHTPVIENIAGVTAHVLQRQLGSKLDLIFLCTAVVAAILLLPLYNSFSGSTDYVNLGFIFLVTLLCYALMRIARSTIVVIFSRWLVRA